MGRSTKRYTGLDISVEALARPLIQQHAEDDIVLSQPFGIEFGADLLAHQGNRPA